MGPPLTCGWGRRQHSTGEGTTPPSLPPTWQHPTCCRVDALKEDLPPGTKVVVSNALVKMGVMMLEPKAIRVGASLP